MSGIYQFDKPLPGESLEAYLRRHHCHPDQPDRREATAEEEALTDRTKDYLEGGFILFPNTD
jgi:hypothetical protein